MHVISFLKVLLRICIFANWIDLDSLKELRLESNDSVHTSMFSACTSLTISSKKMKKMKKMKMNGNE